MLDRQTEPDSPKRRHGGVFLRHRLSEFIAGIALLASPAATAVEALTSAELASHCLYLESDPSGVDGQQCIRYIQGFIDGAVATDSRVMLEAENELQGKESFSERAARTRVPSLLDRTRAAQFAGFCLGDPLPLRNVINTVVNDLKIMPTNRGPEPAMETVYASLRKHFPCQQ